jgi:multiple sugar transport system permease protein
MRALGGGAFALDLVAPEGVHDYKYVLDQNQWITDPLNPPPSGSDASRVMLKAPMVVCHPRVVDRSIARDGTLVPAVLAPGAASVAIEVEGRPPVALVEGSWAMDHSSVSDGPDGSVRTLATLFANPGPPLPGGRYTIRIRWGLRARLAALYTLDNYREVVTDEAFPFGTFFWNSLMVAGLSAFFTTLICTLGGYAFASKQFPGKTALFAVFMASMMVPGMIYMVPQYAVVTRLGWINSWAGMVVPHLANVFGLLLMTNYVRGIPRSLFEAAEVDGASEWQTITGVLFPLATPAMATLFTLTFMGQWSNFLWQLIVNTPDSPCRTLPVGLALFKGQYDLKVEAMMAAATFSVVPVAVVFAFTQRTLIAGLTAGGVKE